MASTAKSALRGSGAHEATAYTAGNESAFKDAEAFPDTSYWTAYDHYMIEREARAIGRAYLYAMIGRLWQRVKPRAMHAPRTA